MAAGWAADRWDVADGLPLDRIRAVVQNDDGLIWLATFDGLVRFDGTEFLTLRTSTLPGLPENRIVDLGAEGTDLWLITEAGVLGRLREGSVTTFPMNHRLEAFKSLGGERIIAADRGYARWIEGDPQVWPSPLKDGWSGPIGRDHEALWVGDGAELVRFEANGAGEPVFVAPALIQSLLVESDGVVWMGHRAGVSSYERAGGRSFASDWADEAAACGFVRRSDGSLLVHTSGGWAGVRDGLLQGQGLTETWCQRQRDPWLRDGDRLWRATDRAVLLDGEPILQFGAPPSALITVMEGLHDADPGGYELDAVVHEGFGHQIDDLDAVDWLGSHDRDTRPDRIVWPIDGQGEGRLRDSAFWLAVDLEELAFGTFGEAVRDGARFDVESDDYSAMTVRLDDDMTDLDEPVTVSWGGELLFEGWWIAPS